MADNIAEVIKARISSARKAHVAKQNKERKSINKYDVITS